MPAPAPQPVTVEGRQVKRLSQAEMEERRRLGLCFNCNEKFGRGHNRVCQRIFLLDLAAAEDDDDSEPDEATPGEPQISLHAIAGVRTSETMQMRLTMGGTSLLALIDSGSTHNFIAEEAAARASLPTLTQANFGSQWPMASAFSAPACSTTRCSPLMRRSSPRPSTSCRWLGTTSSWGPSG